MICMHLGRESRECVTERGSNALYCHLVVGNKRCHIYPTSKALRVRVSIRNNMVQAPNLNRMGITPLFIHVRTSYHSTWMDFGLCLLTGGSRFGAGPIYKVIVSTNSYMKIQEGMLATKDESKAIASPSRRFVGHRHVSSRSDTQKPT